MLDFFVTLFAWIGFTTVIGVAFWIWKGRQQPPYCDCSTEQHHPLKESFIVDLNAYHSELPTVYNKNCAFTGILPKGHIPGLPYKYSSVLP